MAIANVALHNHVLLIEPRGINKLWGFRRTIRIPLAHVVKAEVGSASWSRAKGLRWPGLGWFNRWVGQFRKDGAWHYWCAVSGPTLELTLQDEHFRTVILSVNGPRELAYEISREIEQHRG